MLLWEPETGEEDMIYDVIIVGAGAAGLFAGASLSGPVNGLILEKNPDPGRKLLMSGSGQCNLTHGGSIKDFIPRYGEQGSRIRPILYHFNNLAVMEFFQKRGLPLLEREDGKVFPESLKAQDVLSVLVRSCTDNGLKFGYSSAVTAISGREPVYTVHCGEKAYKTENIILAAGGCSYPGTGSDGRLFSVLESMGIRVTPPKPALVPIHVEGFPYGSLSGISFAEASVIIENRGEGKKTKGKKTTGALLLTHDCFSGPAVLNASRYASPGSEIRINYIPSTPPDLLRKEYPQAARGNRRHFSTLLSELLHDQIPKRFLDALCLRAKVDPAKASSAISGSELASVIGLLTEDRFRISGAGGFRSAMVTAGGVALDEVHIKTLESRKYPGIFFAGEILDADGDTGGYNLQFAFSSGCVAAENVRKPGAHQTGTEAEQDDEN